MADTIAAYRQKPDENHIEANRNRIIPLQLYSAEFASEKLLATRVQ